MKCIFGIVYRIKSVQRFGYMIENVNNPADIRRMSVKGWNSYEDLK